MDLNDFEPLARHQARHDFDRLLMLSDGVFAIAITLLALELKVPEHWDGTVANLVQQAWRSMFGFFFGFVVVGLFWVSHRRIFGRLVSADGPLTAINLVLLCLVSLAPAVAELVALHGPKRAMQYWFGLFTLIGFSQFLLWGYATYKATLIHPEVGRTDRFHELVKFAAAPLLGTGLVLATASGMYDKLALPIIVLVLVPVTLVRRRFNKRSSPAGAGEGSQALSGSAPG